MKNNYPLLITAAEQKLSSMLSLLCTDPDNLYCGAVDESYNNLLEPGSTADLIRHCCTLYSCPDSRFYCDRNLLTTIRNACDMILRASHPDGTSDYRATNFLTPPPFELISICRGYKIFVRNMTGTQEELDTRDSIYAAIALWAKGCLNGGFHTPNHRWVESACMAMCYNVIHEPRLLAKIESYLSEGIDCDEYGEFTERSMGTYNPINDNAMMILAEELNKPELYEYALRNMELTFFYHEGDGTVFTRNSTRQDSAYDRTFPSKIWYFLYVWAGDLFHNRKYLKFADDMFRTALLSASEIPDCLWLYLERPQLQTLEPDFTDITIPAEYHAFYPKSRILRVRKGDFSYTLLSRNPDFLHIKFGPHTMTLRMCSSFFAVAQFAPETIVKTETGYRMTFRAHGEYKGLFPTPPASPDWELMDHSLRPVIHSCDLDYTLDITDTKDGLMLHIRVDNTPRVPFKLEFSLPADVKLETDQIMLTTTPGGELTVKQGAMRIEDMPTGCEVTVDGLFADHTYHRNMRGSIPPMPGSFAVYSTGSSPIDRTISIRFSKRTCSKPMHQKI